MFHPCIYCYIDLAYLLDTHITPRYTTASAQERKKVQDLSPQQSRILSYCSVPRTQEQIAKAFQLHRSAVSRQLRTLKEKNVITEVHTSKEKSLASGFHGNTKFYLSKLVEGEPGDYPFVLEGRTVKGSEFIAKHINSNDDIKRNLARLLFVLGIKEFRHRRDEPDFLLTVLTKIDKAIKELESIYTQILTGPFWHDEAEAYKWITIPKEISPEDYKFVIFDADDNWRFNRK